MAVAFGYVDLVHVFKKRIGEMDSGIQIVREANARQLQYANDMADVMTSRLSESITQPLIQFEQGSGGTLQPIGPDGNPLPTYAREAYQVGFPIRGGGDATGTDRVTRALMTVQDANDNAQAATIKDKNWLIDHMLAALMTSTEYTYEDKARLGYRGVGDVTVKPLANNDGQRYIGFLGRALTDGTHNHYLRVLPITATDNPFPTIHRHLREHTGNTDEVVDVYIAENLEVSIRALPNFVKLDDPDIEPAQTVARLRSRPDKGIGDEVIGKVDKCWIITMGRLPDNYMLALRRDGRPLGRREYPASALQGLFNEEFSPDGSHMEVRWLRFAGFGVRDRTAAVAVFIAGSGNYVNPALLTAPLATSNTTG